MADLVPDRYTVTMRLYPYARSPDQDTPTPARHPDHHRHLDLAVEHVRDRGCVVDDLVEGEPRPLALFDAARVDFSLRRLVHYTGSDWRHVQRWILLTNYHRYVDQFVRRGSAELQRPGATGRLVLPGNVTIEPGTSP